MKVLILFFLECVLSAMGSPCSDTWSLFKIVNEGPFYGRADTKLFHFEVFRKTEYICYDTSARFRTQRSLIAENYIDIVGGLRVLYSYRNNSEFGTCEHKCSEKQETIWVRYIKDRKKFCESGCDSLSDQSDILVSFVYTNKNCNIMNFSNWTRTTSCSSTQKSEYTRSCLDCDNDRVDQNFCFGNPEKYEKCQLIWSEWSEAGPCVISGCNSTGVRIKTKKCLYEDGSEASSAQLCSNKSSTIMREECVGNITNLLCDSASQEANLSDTTLSVMTPLILTKSYFVTSEKSLSVFKTDTTNKNKQVSISASMIYVSVVIATVAILITIFVFFKTTMYPKDQQRHSALRSNSSTSEDLRYYKIETPFCCRMRERLRELFHTANDNNEAPHTLHIELSALPYDYALENPGNQENS